MSNDGVVIPLTGLHRTAAKHMVRAWQSPVFHLNVEVDMTGPVNPLNRNGRYRCRSCSTFEVLKPSWSVKRNISYSSANIGIRWRALKVRCSGCA
jgi:hypothetical protein